MKKLTIPTTVRLALDHTALIMTEQPFMKMYSYRNIVIGNIRLEFTIFSTYSTSAGSSTQWRVKDTLLKKYRTIGSICKEFRTSKTFDRNIGKSTKFVTIIVISMTTDLFPVNWPFRVEKSNVFLTKMRKTSSPQAIKSAPRITLTIQ